MVSYVNALDFLESARFVVGPASAAMMPLAQRDMLLGRVMGRALAHELAHYLLETKTHTLTGLLQTARIPEPYRAQGSLEFAKQLLAKAKVSVSPGIGFGEFGDQHVRFAMIENESRTRQAIRGIKQMFRDDRSL